jgi:hypothetical protein
MQKCLEIAPCDSSDEDTAAHYNVAEQCVQQENSPEEQDHDVEEETSVQYQNQGGEAGNVRSTVDEKGKGLKHDSSDSDDSEDSDFICVHGDDDSNSSAEDDEAIAYRLQAKEIKRKVKKKMLGEEEFESCNVPDEFIVPENCKMGDDSDDSPFFDTEDDVSYSDDSDGEVAAVRTRRTKHRVYVGV